MGGNGHRLLLETGISHEVLDASEEIFLLYTSLKTSSGSNGPGLGMISEKERELDLTFELPFPWKKSSTNATTVGKKAKKSAGAKKDEAETVDIILHQNPSLLQGSKGDTGSVLWRTTPHLLRLLPSFLLPPTKSQPLSALELGAGTGLFSILLSRYFSPFISSDRHENTSLISRNVRANNSTAEVRDIDWTHYTSLSPTNEEIFDVVFALDTLYSPSLLKPFLTTLNYYTTPIHTLVVIGAEMRSSEVLEEFLEMMLDPTKVERWRLFRVDDGAGEGDGVVIWIGWRDI